MTQRHMIRGRARSRERGVALPFALFAIVGLLIASTGALLIGASEIQATRNYRGAQQVHFVAESGLTHALQRVNAVGIVNFENELVDNWDNWLGSAARPFPGLAGYAYTVTPIANPANPAEQGWLRSVATGPEGVQNVAVARVQQSNIPGTAPGAIYLANDNATNATFTGNAFEINGNDFNYNGTPGPGQTMPGLAARNEANTNEAINSLNNQQKDNVLGMGFQPPPATVPSVMTAPTGASVAQINALIDSLLAIGPPTVVDVGGSKITGSATFGTTAAPQITHFTANNVEIKANGNASGAGIMIVEGDLKINGGLDFAGLVLVRGATTIGDETTVTGNATVYGSIWTNNLNLNLGGSAIVRYSTQALALADQVGAGGLFPAPLNVLALINCQQVAPGTDGCPA